MVEGGVCVYASQAELLIISVNVYKLLDFTKFGQNCAEIPHESSAFRGTTDLPYIV